jgi:hypothetical protein
LSEESEDENMELIPDTQKSLEEVAVEETLNERNKLNEKAGKRK